MPAAVVLLFSFALIMMPVSGQIATASITTNLQPDINPAPSLPSNFSIKPEYWKHSTPLLQSPKIPAIPSSVEKRASFWTGWGSIAYLFAFGDSYSSTNFTISGEQPNPSNPLGNPAYPGLTSSDGPNFIDFLTSTYNQSYVQTYNFGYGGAVINDSVVHNGFGPTVKNFEDQVEKEFLPTYVNNRGVPWSSSNTLFSIFFGINDVTNSWAMGNDSLNYEVIQSYQNLVNTLYNAGARNFLFLNVPPVDRSPGTIEQGPASQAAEAGYLGRFNFRLGALVHNLGVRHSDTTSFLFDTNFLFTRVLDDPTQFAETAGLRNTTEYCVAYENSTPTMTYFDPSCGIPVNEYFWLNTLHPTFPVHNFMGSQIVRLLETMG
ncbi:hypothetical protein ACLMJK_000397 [Lecanora helva]